MKRLHLLSLLLAPSAAALADTRDGDGASGAIVVTAARTPQPADSVGQSVSVVDRATIVTRQTVSVADLLATLPGVTISRSGTIGSATTVNLHGAAGDEVLVLIDGVRVNDPSAPAGAFDFGPLVAGTIDRIEVERGSNSVPYGSQAIGGVINIVTTAPDDRTRIDAAAEYGYAHGALGRVAVSGKIGSVGGSLGLTYLRSDGISSFDAGDERDSNRNLTASGKLIVPLGHAASLDLRGTYIHSNVGIDGFPAPLYAFADTRERSIGDQYVGYAGLNLALFDGRFANRFAYTRYRSDRRSIDPDGFVRETLKAKGDDKRIEYEGRLALLPDRLSLVAGFEYERPMLAIASYEGPVTRAHSDTDSAYGLAIVQPFTELSLSGGARYDHHAQFGGATTLGANGAWRLPTGTILRASYGEGFKAPTLYQLYGDYGNRTLSPARSRSVDAGIEQRLAEGRLRLAATLFRRAARDEIDFVSCYGLSDGICTDRPYGTYDNVDRSLAKGIEATAEFRPSDALTLTMAWTHSDARDRATGDRLARRPADVETASLDYRWRFGLSTGSTILAVGDSFDDAANMRALAGYVRTDLRAALPIGHGVELYGRIENLFDVGYETVFQYGSYGRAAYGGIRLSI